MKKILIVILVSLLAFAFIRIATSTYENISRKNDEKMEVTPQSITDEEAEQLCYQVMGKQDETTGFPFSFGVTNTIQHDGKEYYAIRASWLVNNSHLSYIGDFFVSFDGKEIYTGFVNNDEYIFEKQIWRK